MVAPPSMPVDFAPNVAKARAVVQQAIARGNAWLAPVEISALLEAYDIPIAPARLARTPEEAAEVARLVLGRYGGCVVKIMSRDIIHKSDLGGVVLDLRSVEQVVEATRKMLDRVAIEAPHARVDGVTIHPMVRRPMRANWCWASPTIPPSGRSSCSGAAARRSRSSTTRRWRCRRSTCRWRAA